MRWRPSLVIAGVVLAGCTSSPPDSPDRRETTKPPPSYDVPIVIVTHLEAGLNDLSAAEAEAVLDTGTAPESLAVVTADVEEVGDDVRTLPTAAEAVAVAAADPGTIAVVPVTAATPRVRILTVDGVGPAQGSDYPLMTSTPTKPGARVVTTIVGDIMLGRRVGDSLDRQGDPAAAFAPFAARLAAADITVGNLESTLSRKGEPTQGGDSFAADDETLAGPRAAGIDVFSLGNNHLGDYGQRAIDETVAKLLDEGFTLTGGGRDLAEARKAAVVERKGVRIGFIATDSIGETPAARADRAGTNRINAPPRTGPLDQKALDRVAGDIRTLAATTDLVIVMPHWGTQYTHTPEKSQRTMAKAFANAGADLIVGGHPHWVQGWEAMGEATVIHSLGNFVFDMDFMRKTNEGVFVEIISMGDQIIAIEPVPYVIDGDFTPRPASRARAASTMEDIRDSSRAPFTALR